MDIEALEKLGLTKAESRVYTSALKLGACSVKDIAKESGFHRTNIYDILEQLKEKGLITFLKEGKVLRFSVTDPHNLYDFLRERQEVLDAIFPEVVKLHAQSAGQIEVGVFKGAEGMKAAFRDMLRANVALYGFGIKGQLREKLPAFAKQWLRDAKAQNLQYYGIYTKREDPPSYFTELRYVSDELSSPVATFIYGDKININIWEPSLVAIVIKSKLVATMYKKHFDLLWRVADQ